ncbi:MAG TPA: transposase [Thermoanaerobaculia bacterium]|jgi:putative transposase|nr:transposase [Thermoanaerobaculia bacterium]
MARPLRLEFAGALYHLTSRGNEQRPIFRSAGDRKAFLGFLRQAVQRFGWSLTAWVLMTNHFHLVVQTPEPNLSRGMHWLNSVYVGWFNRVHKRSGHLYQGRFKAFLIDEEAYFAEVLRYVVLNPVRAKMVEKPEDYRWSSYRATAGLESAPDWLDLAAVLPLFGGEQEPAQTAYREFVLAKIGCEDRLWEKLTNQLYLGTEEWIKMMRGQVVEAALDGSPENAACRRTAEDAHDPRCRGESSSRDRGFDPRNPRWDPAPSGGLDRMARRSCHAALDRRLPPAPKRGAHLESHQTLRPRVCRESGVAGLVRYLDGNAASLITE